ncbi:MAG: BRO family protein [Pseudomonadota bacterium]
MSNVTLFAFDDALIRVHMDEEGNPWFVAKDVCKILELSNPTEALRSLDEDEKITLSNSEGNPRAGIPHTFNCISESGLYSLIFRSRKPEAKSFRKWVTAEVLPSLRKTGTYSMQEEPKERARAWEHLEIPEEALALRPTLRERVLNLAMQGARMGTGTQAEVQELFHYYAMIIGAPQKFQQMETGKEREKAETKQIVEAWAEEYGICRAQGGNGQKVQAKILYEEFSMWAQRQDIYISMRAFGEVMATLFAKKTSNRTYYWVDRAM